MEELKRQLFDALPRYYDESAEVDAIMSANAGELAGVRRNARDLLDQFFVATATWGLADWERVLALSPDPSASLDFRRQRILAKLAGNAPATIKYLTDLVNVYVAKKDAKIIEHAADYSFEAEIPLDSPVDTVVIRKAVGEVKPAHLAFNLTGRIDAERISVRSKARSFGVPYPITDRFSTARTDGKLIRGTVGVETKISVFKAIYPITNVMRTPTLLEKHVVTNFDGRLMISNVKVPYSNTGDTYSGEVEL